MKRVLYLFLTSINLVIYTSCEKVHHEEIDNLQNKKNFKIGHGGMGFPSLIPFNYYPTNSMSAFKEAIQVERADGVEMDIHMTSDYDFVLYHDKKLDSKTDFNGYPEEMELNKLVGIPYQIGFPYDFFQEEKIISLDSSIQYFKSLPVFPILQLDIRNYCENFKSVDNDVWEKKMGERLIEKLDKYNLKNNKVHLISISRKLCLYFMQNSGYKVSYEINMIEEGLDWAIENNLKSVTIHSENLTIELCKQAHDNHIEVIGFGTKSKTGNLNLIQKNPDYIQTDNLSSLNILLSE